MHPFNASFPTVGILDHKTFDLVLQSADLVLELAGFIRGDRSSNHRSADVACAAKGDLGRDVDVWDVLIFTEKGQVKQDRQRSAVACEDDDLRDTTGQGLGALVRALLQQGDMTSLLHEVQDLLGQSRIGHGPCSTFLTRHGEYLKKKGQGSLRRLALREEK